MKSCYELKIDTPISLSLFLLIYKQNIFIKILFYFYWVLFCLFDISRNSISTTDFPKYLTDDCYYTEVGIDVLQIFIWQLRSNSIRQIHKFIFPEI